MLEIRLKTRCYPTEERGKIENAVRNIFPDAEVHGDELLEADSFSLETFRELIKRHRIRAAARAVLLRGVDGETTSFRLNKQVATVGKISFATESHPLGDIEVTIMSDDIRGLIESLTSRKEG